MRYRLSALVLAGLCASSSAWAASRGRFATHRVGPAPRLPKPATTTAMGFQFDLFPTVVSAVNGRAGYAPQVWLGVKPLRLRLIGAHLEPPDAFTFNDEVIKPKLSALAATIDYTFGPHFDGVWLGAGTEAWLQSAEAANGSGQSEWTSAVFTVGGGYIWRFAGNFYLDPWLGLHWTLNPTERLVGDVAYEPPAVSLSASVKVGWFFWAR